MQHSNERRKKMSETTQTTERVKLSQWDAIVLESVRALGLDGEELLRRVARGDLPPADGSIITDFAPLLTLHQEQPEILEQAVKQGYRIKYNTLGGINTWIRIVFGLESEVEREEGIEGVAVELTATERDLLFPVLSIGWTIEAQSGEAARTDATRYRVVPVRG